MPHSPPVSIGKAGANLAFNTLQRRNALLSTPCEVNICGIYCPPLLIAGCLGLLVTYLVAKVLTRFRISRFFAAPSLVFVALVVIFSGLIETFFIVG